MRRDSHGGVAQLGERGVRNAKVESSNLFASTPRKRLLDKGLLREFTPASPHGSELRPVAPSADGVDKRTLREAMIDSFGREDLEILCADVEQALQDAGLQEAGRPVQLSLDMFRGGGIQLKVLDLIRHLDRRG